MSDTKAANWVTFSQQLGGEDGLTDEQVGQVRDAFELLNDVGGYEVVMLHPRLIEQINFLMDGQVPPQIFVLKAIELLTDIVVKSRDAEQSAPHYHEVEMETETAPPTLH